MPLRSGHSHPSTISRRRFGVVTASVLAALAPGAACDVPGPLLAESDGRIIARPQKHQKLLPAGTHALELDSRRDALLLMPASLTEAPVPLAVMLHGATGTAERFVQRFTAICETAKIALLIPNSRDTTWDAIRSGLGPDVSFLNRAMEKVFERLAVDSSRLTVGGFSDGASYALTLGLINGDLFQRVIAFSPGFIVEGTPHGKPAFFISHGTNDDILPIDRCSRRIVPDLKRRGYEVTFREFDGGHQVPPAIAGDALAWAAGAPA